MSSNCTVESHEAAKLDPVKWVKLRFRGGKRHRAPIPASGTEPAYILEYADCPLCGSSLGLEDYSAAAQAEAEALFAKDEAEHLQAVEEFERLMANAAKVEAA